MKREIERAKDAPKVAPYHDNMKLCPGQNRSLYDPEPRHRSVNPPRSRNTDRVFSAFHLRYWGRRVHPPMRCRKSACRCGNPFKIAIDLWPQFRYLGRTLARAGLRVFTAL